MRAQGMSEVEIAAREIELRASAESGRTDVRCVMSPSDLVHALTERSNGTFNSASWESCKTPKQPCLDAAPSVGFACTVDGCDGGSWVVRCGAHTCRVDGTVAEGATLSCAEGGKITVAFEG